jgi:hypothetical protein
VKVAAVLAVVAASLAAASQASAFGWSTFEGSCQVNGPIYPRPGITAFPQPSARAEYHGVGTCDGKLNGTAISHAPARIDMPDQGILFDTCEFGPDVDLHGILQVSGPSGPEDFKITIDLLRLAVAGPFLLTGPHSGRALGTAQFTPKDQAAAVQGCGAGGVTDASLAASFNTLRPLAGRLKG